MTCNYVVIFPKINLIGVVNDSIEVYSAYSIVGAIL